MSSIADSLASLLATVFADAPEDVTPFDPGAIMASARQTIEPTPPAPISVPESPRRRSTRSPYRRNTTNWREVQAIEVLVNDTAKRVEIRFPSKPSEATRETMKSRGWRWHAIEGCWYHFVSGDNVAFAKSLVR